MVPVGELKHPGGVGGLEGLLERGLAQLLEIVEEEAIGGEQELHHGVRVDIRQRRFIGGRLFGALAPLLLTVSSAGSRPVSMYSSIAINTRGCVPWMATGLLLAVSLRVVW